MAERSQEADPGMAHRTTLYNKHSVTTLQARIAELEGQIKQAQRHLFSASVESNTGRYVEHVDAARRVLLYAALSERDDG